MNVRTQWQNRGISLGLLLAACSAWAACAATELQWRADQGFRWAPLEPPKDGKAGFSQVPAETTGIYFTNTVDEAAGAANRVLNNGSGVAVGDFDNDGLPDIFL